MRDKLKYSNFGVRVLTMFARIKHGVPFRGGGEVGPRVGDDFLEIR